MRPGTVLAVLAKDLRLSLRSKHVLFWSIVFPIMLLTLLVVLFAPKPQAPPPAKVTKVYVVTDYSNETLVKAAKEYVKYMNSISMGGAKYFDAKIANVSLDEALKLLKEGKLDAVVYIDSEMYDAFISNFTLKARVYVLRGTPDPTGENLAILSLSWFFNTSANFVSVNVASYAAHEIEAAVNFTPLNPQVYAYLDQLVRASRGLQASLARTELDPETAKYLRELAESSEGLNALLREAPLHPNITVNLVLLKTALSKYANNTEIEWVEVRPRGAEKAKEVRPYVIGWMTLSVIFMMFMFNGVLGAAVSVSTEFGEGYMRRILSTSVEPTELYVGKMLATLAINTITSVLILLWGMFALGAKFTHGLIAPETASVLVIMLDATILAMSIGVLIGLLVRSPEAANLAANAIIWPTMMIGGFWVPKFMMPPEIRWFADVNPFSNLMYAVVEISCYGRGIGAYLVPVLVTAAFSVVLLAVSTLLYKRRVARMVEG